MQEKTTAEVAATDLMGVGAAMIEPRQVAGGAPFLVIPNNFKVESLEKLMGSPVRARGNTKLLDAASFIRHVNKHKDRPGVESGAAKKARPSAEDASVVDAEVPSADDMATVISVDQISQKFKAIFDTSASDAPGFGEHTATYDCPIAPEWKVWKENNGKRSAMNQEDFAFFIEQHILDIREPVGATMLETVTTLKSAKNVLFDSGVRLQDGQVQLKYHEESKTTAGANGQLQIPEEIKLGIPVYVGGVVYAVRAKFRYRIEQTKLFMWYDLVLPEKVEEDAIKELTAEIEKGTGIKPYAAAV